MNRFHKLNVAWFLLCLHCRMSQLHISLFFWILETVKVFKARLTVRLVTTRRLCRDALNSLTAFRRPAVWQYIYYHGVAFKANSPNVPENNGHHPNTLDRTACRCHRLVYQTNATRVTMVIIKCVGTIHPVSILQSISCLFTLDPLWCWSNNKLLYVIPH